MVRKALAVFLALHGIVHYMGAAVPWGLIASPDNPYTTTVFWGRLDVGEAGIRVVGILWLIPLVAFVVAAVALWQRRPSALRAALVAAVISAGICLLGMPAAVAGLVINGVLVALVVAVFAMRRVDPSNALASFAR